MGGAMAHGQEDCAPLQDDLPRRYRSGDPKALEELWAREEAVRLRQAREWSKGDDGLAARALAELRAALAEPTVRKRHDPKAAWGNWVGRLLEGILFELPHRRPYHEGD